MIPLEVLNRKSLFSLLYKIDLDLAEQARAGNCPIAGVLCIAPTTLESLVVDPRILKRLSKFALVCAAAGRVVVAACCRLRCVFGAAVSIGRLCCCWSPPCAREKSRPLPCNGSRRFAECGDQPSTVGKATLEIYLPKAAATGACPGILCRRLQQTNCQKPCWNAFTVPIPKRHWSSACIRLPWAHDGQAL